MKVIACNNCKNVIKNKVFHIDIIPLDLEKELKFKIPPTSIVYRNEGINYDRLDFCSLKCINEFFNKNNGDS